MNKEIKHLIEALDDLSRTIARPLYKIPVGAIVKVVPVSTEYDDFPLLALKTETGQRFRIHNLNFLTQIPVLSTSRTEEIQSISTLYQLEELTPWSMLDVYEMFDDKERFFNTKFKCTAQLQISNRYDPGQPRYKSQCYNGFQTYTQEMAEIDDPTDYRHILRQASTRLLASNLNGMQRKIDVLHAPVFTCDI